MANVNKTSSQQYDITGLKTMRELYYKNTKWNVKTYLLSIFKVKFHPKVNFYKNLCSGNAYLIVLTIISEKLGF